MRRCLANSSATEPWTDSELYKKGILCPNEAEMRAYYVLLDLFSRTPPYYDVRPDIYRSPEMQFAVKVGRQCELFTGHNAYSFPFPQVWQAVKSNDWYRYFKATKESTYLQSCLLHLHFNRVRQLALQTMNKAFRCARSIFASFF